MMSLDLIKLAKPVPRNARGSAGLAMRALLSVLGGLSVAPIVADEKPFPNDSTVTLTNAIQVKRLTSTEAARAHPVHVSGMVTYSNPDWNALFVQDGTAGVFVRCVGVQTPVPVGERIEVDGFTSPGSSAPNISRARRLTS